METRKTILNCREYKQTEDGRVDVSLFGALPSDRRVRFILSAPRLLGITDVKFVVRHDGSDYSDSFGVNFTGLYLGYDEFSFVLDPGAVARKLMGLDAGLFYYRWVISTAFGNYALGGEDPTALSASEPDSPTERQLTVYSPFSVSERFCGGIVYQIFPDRFRRRGTLGSVGETLPGRQDAPNENHVFFGGDLYGVAEKLDRVASLGVSAIYLNPVFEASSNHRYDSGDLLKVDPALGGDGALAHMIREAEKRGIAVILDGVFNHTGADSVYFNKYGKYGDGGAYRSKESKYYRWYFFDRYPDVYKCWWGIDTLPKIDCDEVSFRNFIKDEFLKKWCGAGVFGWRIDVADELSDSFLSFFRSAFKSYVPDGVVIGEVWEDASDKISYGKRRRYLQGGELDSVMNYPLRDAIIRYVLYGDTAAIRRATETLYRRYPKPSSDAALNILGTHDTERILTVLGDDTFVGSSYAEKSSRRLSPEKRNLAKRRLMAAYSLVSALPGVPSIFYGDEAGVEGYSDPFCRRPYPWDEEDADLLSHFQKVGRARREEPLFKKGLFSIVYLDERVFAFLRSPWDDGSEYSLLVVFNRSDNRVRVDLRPDLLFDGNSDGSSFDVGEMSVEMRKLSADAVDVLCGDRRRAEYRFIASSFSEERS